MTTSWKPSADLSRLRSRAEILNKTREFFKKRAVMEVETPLLSHHTATDPHVQSFKTYYQVADGSSLPLYLQTSPEFAMKRLLAAGSGPIYQITHAFRNGEDGQWHNPEFSMLEWYRPDFDLSQLMDEIDDLLRLILGCPDAQRISYADLFNRFLSIDPHKAGLNQIKQVLAELSIQVQLSNTVHQRDTGLQLILDYLVQNHLTKDQPIFLYDFPVSQSALAHVRLGSPNVAERVEVYLNGLELANGFYELKDPAEQKERFLKDLATRKAHGLPWVPLDENLIAALSEGFPDCAGIALGMDRLVALTTASTRLAEVISFPISQA